MKNTNKTKKVVGIGLFTAIVVVLQLLGTFIKLGPFSISPVLVPIVVGTALYGVGAGAWLGFAFGVTVLISGDASLFLVVNPMATVLIVLVKGTLAGIVAALVYKSLEKKNKYIAVITAAVICPMINTGVFLAGCSLFFMDTIKEWATAAGFSGSVGSYMIVGLVGFNFIFEVVADVVLSPVAVRLIAIGKKEIK